MKKNKIVMLLITTILISCRKENNIVVDASLKEKVKESVITNDNPFIKVDFEVGESIIGDNVVVEDTETLKALGKEHSVKYYSYMPTPGDTKGDFTYYDVIGNKRVMAINDSIMKNEYKWENEEGVFYKKAPIGCTMSYGIDISKHNGKINFKKVKDAGFDFVFIRIAYRGYGKSGNLKEDEMQEVNIKNAKKAGLKVGAYVFSQSINEKEAVEEARFAINLLKGMKLDLPLVYDPETIKNDVARTDNISKEQFTKNAIAFLEEVKRYGYEPALYSNMVWEDYYYNLEKLKGYDIWYADYNKLPQTPYDFKFWQFSEVGIVDGVKGNVDLNVMIER